jgi:phospholipid/cholesterol/gamma-HCH transport system ATP-binding protein
MGVLFQDGALFGSLNVYDNTAFPLRKHTDKAKGEIREIVVLRLAEVALARPGGSRRTRSPAAGASGFRPRAGDGPVDRVLRRA